MRLRLASRGSALALWQTNWVADRLRGAVPGLQTEVATFTTTGDATQAAGVPMSKVGTKGLFTKELEDALLAGNADIAVHSLKDVPSDLPAGLALLATPARADARDALVSRDGHTTLEGLAPGARVGTSSLRRVAQLRHYRPDLEYIPVRGNVDTRLRKLDEGQYDALVMAAAGLTRLGHEQRISQHLSPEVCLPAVGQGALAIEGREGDQAVAGLCRAIHDPVTAACTAAERAFMATLTRAGLAPTEEEPGLPGQAPPMSGSCQVPIGAFALAHGDHLHIKGLVAMVDGSQLLTWEAEGPLRLAETLGRTLAEHLLDQGAAAMVQSAHGK